jgi:hypothetical protein
MRTVPLAEAALQFGKSERTIRRMIANGQLRGEQVKSGGRYLWMVTLEDAATVPAVAATTPDAVEMFRLILQQQERILSELAALRGDLARSLPASRSAEEAPRYQRVPEVPRPTPPRWWRRLFRGP